MTTGRTDDILELYRLLNREPHKEVRDKIKESIKLVKNEDGAIRSMRESLLKAHRNGDVDEIKDIHDFISKKRKYHH